MSFITKEIKVINSKGLHARPSTLFVETAKKFESDIKVEFNNKIVNGKSLLALMSLGVPKDGIISVSVEEPKAEMAILQFIEILGKNYD